MCFTPEEKNDLTHRIAHLERQTDEQQTTIRVALYTGSAFAAILISIAVWYLGSRDNAIEQTNNSLQQIAIQITELRVSMEFYSSTLTTHSAIESGRLNDVKDQLNQHIQEH